MDKNPFPFFMTFWKDTAYPFVTKIRISNQFEIGKDYPMDL